MRFVTSFKKDKTVFVVATRSIKVFDLLRLERDQTEVGIGPVLKVVQAGIDVTEGVGAGFDRRFGN